MNKVLYITNYPSPYRVQFFNELGKKCNLTVTFEETPEQQPHRSKDWFDNNYENFSPIFLKQIYKLKINGKRLYYFPEIKKIIKKGNFDYIIIGGYSIPSSITAINYMRKNKIPYILSTDGGVQKSGKGIIEQFKRHYISNAGLYLSTGKKTDEYLRFYGANPSKIRRYPFTTLRSIDILKKPLTTSQKNNIRKRLHIRQDHKILTSVGQITYGKGFDVLLNAVPFIDNDAELYIIGGKPTKELSQIIEKNRLKNRVHFIDFQKKEILYEYLKCSDIFVFPTRHDVWGLVVNEAMANGLPVITTDQCVAGLELIEDEINGYIIPAENSKILADKINVLLKSNLRAISQNNINKISNYTIENMTKQTYNILSNLPKNKYE